MKWGITTPIEKPKSGLLGGKRVGKPNKLKKTFGNKGLSGARGGGDLYFDVLCQNVGELDLRARAPADG